MVHSNAKSPSASGALKHSSRGMKKNKKVVNRKNVEHACAEGLKALIHFVDTSYALRQDLSTWRLAKGTSALYDRLNPDVLIKKLRDNITFQENYCHPLRLGRHHGLCYGAGGADKPPWSKRITLDHLLDLLDDYQHAVDKLKKEMASAFSQLSVLQINSAGMIRHVNILNNTVDHLQLRINGVHKSAMKACKKVSAIEEEIEVEVIGAKTWKERDMEARQNVILVE